MLTLAAAALFSSRARAAPPPLGVPIASGWFVRGSATGDADERPPRRLWLEAFAIDRFEVTRGRYAGCVRSGRCRPPQVYDGPRGENLPVVGVSWEDASAYCAWRGGRLPTEAEWERAARGSTPRVYPWGDALRCDRANFGNFAGDGLCAGKNPGHVVAVGSYPRGASPEGVLDLAGNVWEWVADAYGPYDQRVVRNPRGPAKPRPGAEAADGLGRQTRVVRGGSCCSYFSLPRTSNRLHFPPDYVDVDLGFRCAR
ncbi:MAG: formylglycine-generating enzyme family protein [Proteobacteria bacterium]|nr:formylglycine-generating enzyme family protein [Pseudomonadota bacterium]